jgi:hypothetical protein
MRNEMENRFYYSAFTYLGEWMASDRFYHENLAAMARDEASDPKKIEWLVKATTYYKVIRTLKTIEEKPRLLAAYTLLQAIPQPEDIEDVIRNVHSFAEGLQAVYGTYALSAASKFLWMRFRSPIVIYDSVASGWLKNHGYKESGGYRSYVESWSKKYGELEEEIAQACRELNLFKKFTLANKSSDESLTKLTNSGWFRERVFDHFMLNWAIENESSD